MRENNTNKGVATAYAAGKRKYFAVRNVIGLSNVCFMKKYYLVIIFLCPLILLSQKKVDLDRYNFTVQFHSLPAMHLDSTYHTYNVVVEGTKMMQSFLQQLSPANSVIIDGWRKLPQDGHITIKVKLEDLLPESVSIKERTENIKNLIGQITGTRILYH